MTQQDINEAVATATCESVALINDRVFGIPDPLDVQFNTEPRRPLVLDWDSMTPAEWPYWLD